MRSKLYNAIQTNDTRTENGMPAHSTSGNAVLDMFFKMGGARSWSDYDIENMFANAFLENPVLAVKALFYNRDIRGGQGERRSFRVMFKWLCENHPFWAGRVIALVPEYGRWDDLFVALDTRVAAEAVADIRDAIVAGNILAKKWMPREGKGKKNGKGEIAFQLMDMLNMSPDEYRNFIAFSTEDEKALVVETLMCENRWDDINFNTVPSVASKKLRKAFGRHNPERYAEWLSKLEKGEKSVKINAGAIFPHDIVRPYLSGQGRLDRTLEAQWKALPDYVKEGLSFIPVVDTSASMTSDLAWEVAFALGVYLAERNKSVFENGYITFSSVAKLITLSGSLRDKVSTFVKNAIVQNTNIESVYDLILSKAKEAKLAPEDMPTHILILSDMQFDQGVENRRHNAQQMARSKFEKAGYDVPQIVYWNLRSSNGVPVKFDENGTALVSGFSPSLMQSLLGGELTPEGMMMTVLNSARYAPVEEALS